MEVIFFDPSEIRVLGLTRRVTLLIHSICTSISCKAPVVLKVEERFIPLLSVSFNESFPAYFKTSSTTCELLLEDAAQYYIVDCMQDGGVPVKYSDCTAVPLYEPRSQELHPGMTVGSIEIITKHVKAAGTKRSETRVDLHIQLNIQIVLAGEMSG